MHRKLLWIAILTSSLALSGQTSAALARGYSNSFDYPVASSKLRVGPPAYEPMLLVFRITERFLKDRLASVYLLELTMINTSEDPASSNLSRHAQCEFLISPDDECYWHSAEVSHHFSQKTTPVGQFVESVTPSSQSAESIQYRAEWDGRWDDDSLACCTSASFVATVTIDGCPLSVTLGGVETPRAIRRRAVSVMQGRIDSLERSYEDLPLDHWAYNAMEFLSKRGLQRHYPPGFFDRSVPRMRADFIKAIQMMFEDPQFDKSDEQIRIMLDTLRAEFAAQYY